MLTENGYVLKTPPSPFTYPQTSPNTPTTPVYKDYLPPQPVPPSRRPQPQQSQPRPQPQPRPQTPQRPQPQPQLPQPKPQSPVYNEIKPKPQAPSAGTQYLPPSPQPTKPQYRPPAPQPPQPSRPQYSPPTPQLPTQPARPQYSPPAPQPTPQQYLPPVRQPPATAARPTVPQPPRKIPSSAGPTYLPPVGPSRPTYSGDRDVQSSNQEKLIYQPKPIRGEDQLSPQIFPTPKFREKSVFTPAKCASALVCTPENYCSSIGVLSETPVEITPFRVPLTDCTVEETGAPGKCCRDPNYVDPWPVNLAGVCASRNKVCFVSTNSISLHNNFEISNSNVFLPLAEH